jgi:hypothetical protein
MMLTHLYELLRQRAAAHPTATALGGQQGLRWHTLDSRQLLDLVDHLAGELAALGVREGDRVVTWLPNHWRTPVYLFAVWKLGAIVVPFDREMNADAARRILASVAPRLVLVGYDEPPTWATADEVTPWWAPGGPPSVPPNAGGEAGPSPRHPPRVRGAGGAYSAAAGGGGGGGGRSGAGGHAPGSHGRRAGDRLGRGAPGAARDAVPLADGAGAGRPAAHGQRD